jgi:hypothetical protein
MEYKNISAIVEKKFTIENTAESNLYIVIDNQNIKILITYNNQLQALFHYYFFKPIENWQSSIFESILNENTITAQTDWQKVLIIPPFHAFTLIPKSIFDMKEANHYLEYVTPFEDNYIILANEQKYFEAMNVFDVDKNIYEYAINKYKNVDFGNITETFLNFIQKTQKKDTISPQMQILVNTDYLLISLLVENKVEFCNVFYYKTAQDFLYFVILVLDQLRLDKNSTEIKLYGQITQVAEIYRLLNNYVNKLSIGEIELNTLVIKETFDVVPKIQYTDIWTTLI